MSLPLEKMNMEEVMEIESTMGKGTKRPTDANAPKRPLTPFFLWATKARASLAKAHPEWSMTETSKELGNMWKKVPQAEVSGFQAKYEKARSAYDAKMEKYRKTANYKKFCHELLAFKVHETKKSFRSDPNAPKRYLSAYMLYLASSRDEIIKENPDFAPTEIVKEQSLRWKALSESERKPYVEQAEVGQRKYKKMLEKYHKTSEYQTFVAERDAYKAKMVAKRNKLMGIKKPKKKRARSESKAKKAKKAKRSSGSRKQKRRRSSSPKGSTSRSASRRRSSKKSKSRRKSSRKGSKRRGAERRKSRRKGKRAAKRSKKKAPSRSASEEASSATSFSSS